MNISQRRKLSPNQPYFLNNLLYPVTELTLGGIKMKSIGASGRAVKIGMASKEIYRYGGTSKRRIFILSLLDVHFHLARSASIVSMVFAHTSG